MATASVRPARVCHIPTAHICANPHNPRRLFDVEPMAVLRESIRKLGILVPLAVYPRKAKASKPARDPFVLLDGERRWRCAVELKLKKVPATIIEEPSDVQNILTMFHIHNVRQGWQLMPTALKLKQLMRVLRETNERKLAELTKLKVATIRRCKDLLSYPRKHQKMMLAPPSARLKADFFIDLNRFRKPARADNLRPWRSRGDVACIDIMIAKYEDGVIKAVTEFRDLASIYRGSQRRGRVRQFEKALGAFFAKHQMRIEDIVVPGATFERELREVSRSCRRLHTQLDGIEPAALAADSALADVLRTLEGLIRAKLEAALVAEDGDA